MMDEIRRHAAEHEAVEGVEALTAYHQESVPFRRAFQDCRGDRTLFFADRALELQRCKLLVGFLESFGERASMRWISF